MSTDRRTRAWVEVDASALQRNARRLADAVGPSTRLVPMVKANAYGLGVTGAVRAFAPLRPLAWGVATADEGAAVRAEGVREPIHVYSPLPPEELRRAVASGLTPTLSHPGELALVAEAAPSGDSPAPFQLEVDTGMGRAGVQLSGVEAWARALADLPPNLRWTGLFTHFHSSDVAGGPEMETQLRRFREAVGVLRPSAEVLVHTDNSAAALRRHGDADETGIGVVRAGIFAYGSRPGPDLPTPEPVVSLRARVSRVVEVAPGTPCGYGATYRAQEAERWATLPVGYADGVPRRAVPGARVLIDGTRVPLVGRVSMDMVVANISGLDGVRPGHVATILGRDGDGEITVDEMAAWAETISYEILIGLGTRLPRIWNTGNEDDDGDR